MKRKSPIKHKVRSHTRKGKIILDYFRGHGERPKKISKPTVKIYEKSRKDTNKYRITIKYIGNQRESFTVEAPSYPKAIEQSLISRLRVTPPKQIDVIKI